MSRPVLVVTGGAGGIGSAVARRFDAQGWHVVVVDRDAERGGAVARECTGLFVHADATTTSGCEQYVEATLAKHGRIDLLHLNVGVLARTSIGEGFDPADYQRMMRANVDSAVFGVQAAFGPMRDRGGGSILVTSSTTGLRPSPDALYSASKHAVVGLVRSLAPALLEVGVRINALCPGAVDTAMLADRRDALVRAGVGLVAPEDVATAAQAAHDAGRTGQAWVVNAGLAVAPHKFTEILIEGEARIQR
ncbi:SDR family oxidoreductase [Frankia sp. R82]|uniref:SDR family NAD(P)-dependent oxidoreductase n=1 Tax=Frankia sp. R82 TaxID=2950553 RepID=UPI00204428A5|nr:SDR family oxidoreductase [Frankia sp. R82]MCM3887560.1 SDR family oxidoreductase [Frankia sp. R82]